MFQKIMLFILAILFSGVCSDTIAADGQDEKGKKCGRHFAQTGTFMDSAVSGLTYKGESRSGITDKDGRFLYNDDELLTFSIGTLVLGTTQGKKVVTPLDLVEDAASADDVRVNNMLALLQTLDKNGDLNDGIQISRKISDIVSGYAGQIVFDQATTDFAADPNVLALIAELNQAGVFSDNDPRDRTLRKSLAALEHFERVTSERKIIPTRQGLLRGFAADDSTWQFLGIPYAKPPIGDLRWKPTQKPKKWHGIRDAVAWGDQAAQTFSMEQYGEGGMSEDCLYLNITTPKDAKDLPVMVWFHGGAFTILTGNTKGYNNTNSLTTKGVILVTVCHRLGPFGYIAHPLLAEESESGGSGNYGQMDLVAALTWVQKNISAFGGDPDNVTIFGQSGGGAKSVSLMMSPMAKGLFHKAIVMSGVSVMNTEATVESVIADAEAVGTALFDRLGVTTLEEARALPWTAVIQADEDAGIPRQIYRPGLDYRYISDTYYNTLVGGQPNDVPLLIGCTAADYPSIIAAMKQQMPLRSEYSASDLFVYKFHRVPTGWIDMGLLANHSGDIPYLFNDPASFITNYYFNLVLDPETGSKPEIGDLNGNGIPGTAGDAADVFISMQWGMEDVVISRYALDIWSNFAKTGDPSIAGMTWPAYTAENDTYVEIGPYNVTVKTGLNTAFP